MAEVGEKMFGGHVSSQFGFHHDFVIGCKGAVIIMLAVHGDCCTAHAYVHEVTLGHVKQSTLNIRWQYIHGSSSLNTLCLEGTCQVS